MRNTVYTRDVGLPQLRVCGSELCLVAHSRCDALQSHRAQPDGVDGSMELNARGNDDDEQLIGPSDTMVSSLPELSTLDYSPDATPAAITFEATAERPTHTPISSFTKEDDSLAGDMGENDPPPSYE